MFWILHLAVVMALLTGCSQSARFGGSVTRKEPETKPAPTQPAETLDSSEVQTEATVQKKEEASDSLPADSALETDPSAEPSASPTSSAIPEPTPGYVRLFIQLANGQECQNCSTHKIFHSNLLGRDVDVTTKETCFAFLGQIKNPQLVAFGMTSDVNLSDSMAVECRVTAGGKVTPCKCAGAKTVKPDLSKAAWEGCQRKYSPQENSTPGAAIPRSFHEDCKCNVPITCQ